MGAIQLLITEDVAASRSSHFDKYDTMLSKRTVSLFIVITKGLTYSDIYNNANELISFYCCIHTF